MGRTPNMTPKQSHPFRKKPPFAALIAILAFHGGFVGANDPPFCAHDEPLATRFVLTSLEIQKNLESGCVSHEKTHSGLDLHYVNLNTTSDSVLLSITDSDDKIKEEGLTLVLQSVQPVAWKLAFVGPRFHSKSFQLHIVLSEGSQILVSQVKITSQKSFRKLNLDDSLENVNDIDKVVADRFRNVFGGVTSYVRVQGVNRISNLMPSSTPAKCIPSPGEDSVQGAVNAYLMNRLQIRGCYREAWSGLQLSDVHILNLKSADDILGDKLAHELSPVYLSLVAEKGQKIQRNITLILNSKEPVKWVLQAKGLSGNLKVVTSTEKHIQALGLPQFLHLKVKETKLSSKFEDLLRIALAEDEVVPISYVNLDKGNVINLVIAKEREDIDRNNVPTRRSFDVEKEEFENGRAKSIRGHDLAEKKVLIPGHIIQDVLSQEEFAETFQQMKLKLKISLSVKCGSRLTEVFLDRKATDNLLISQITLNEVSCSAKKNETHWILKSPSTSCGSLNKFSGNNPTFSNNVIVNFSPRSSFYRSNLEIPFSCQLKSGLPGAEEYESSLASTFTKSSNQNSGAISDSEEMYEMRVEREQMKQNRKYSQILLETRSDSANVSPGDKLTVYTNFETRVLLKLALDRCWLSSDVNNDDPRNVPSTNMLISQGCPTSSNENNVSISTLGGRQNPMFTFILSDNHIEMEKVFIFCIIGLCSPTPTATSGNVGTCQDPEAFCKSQSVNVDSPVAQQLSLRGPLYIHPHLHRLDEDPDLIGKSRLLASPATNPGIIASPGLHSSHVVMVGVPAEIAVAISLASFVIGAGLTGMLCCIHHRKATPKSMRNPVVQEDSSELQSMMPTQANGTSSKMNGYTATS